MSLVIGIAYCICGLLICLNFRKTPADSRKTSIAILAFFFFFGITGISGYITKNTYCVFTSCLLSISLMLMGTFLYIKYLTMRCSEQIVGIYVNSKMYSGGKGSRQFAPVFRYNFNGEQYEQQIPTSYSMHKIDSMFLLGNTYRIYIDPDNPRRCIYSKKISLSYYIIGLLGFLIFIFYIYVMYLEYIM